MALIDEIMMKDQTIPERSSYRHWCTETCRYGDTDRQGHINNAVFATFCETGRVMFLRTGDVSLMPGGYEFVLVRQTINFRRELQWGDVVDIGTDVSHLGNTSFTTVQAMFRGADCVATAESVLVLMNGQTRKATTLPDALRDKLR
jgi:acyl-CoA thioester hydrolase